MNFLAVALGGALGSMLRYGAGLWLPFSTGTFAWATFAVNMLGCLAIGLLYPVIKDQQARLFLFVGVLGGFTTFSGFGLEVYRYIEAGSTKLAMTYGVLSLFLGIGLVYIGVKLQAILN